MTIEPPKTIQEMAFDKIKELMEQKKCFKVYYLKGYSCGKYRVGDEIKIYYISEGKDCCVSFYSGISF